MSDKRLPSLLERHWAESALAIGAIVIAAASLWVAYDANLTNRELVASESWPFLLVYENDAAAGPPTMSLEVANEGIGPAKLESFQLFWNGKPQRSPWQLLRSCCGTALGAAGDPKAHAALYGGIGGTSTTRGFVIRPGVIFTFLSYQQTPADAPDWTYLKTHLSDLSFRYCYCSVFNQCWLSSIDFKHFGAERSLNPPEVSVCPRPAVSYNNHRRGSES